MLGLGLKAILFRLGPTPVTQGLALVFIVNDLALIMAEFILMFWFISRNALPS